MTSPKSSRTSTPPSGGDSPTAPAVHPTEELLERYAMGLVQDECVARAEREDDYVQNIKSSLRQTLIQVIESDS
jgi:hypothetical protein